MFKFASFLALWLSPTFCSKLWGFDVAQCPHYREGKVVCVVEDVGPRDGNDERDKDHEDGPHMVDVGPSNECRLQE